MVNRRATDPRTTAGKRFGDLGRSPSVLVGGLVFVLALVLWGWRIQRGVDLSDESIYLAIPMRFVLGDQPFLDDRSSFQGTGIMTMPLVALYHLFVRSNEGLVLFMRIIFLAFLAGISLAIMRAVRGWVSLGSAIACGTIALFFVPYYIPQFSYNTVGGALTLLAAFESLRVSRSTTAREVTRHSVACGLAAAGAGLAYPPLGALFPVHLATLLWFGRIPLGALRVGLRYVGGAAILGVYVGVFVVRAGLGSLKLTYEFQHASGPSVTNGSAAVLAGLNGLKADWFTALAIALALTVLATRLRPVVFLLALAVPFLAAPSRTDATHSVALWACCALFAPLFAFLVKDRKTAFRVMVTVWVPGMLAGLVTSFSSGNGGLAFGLGGFTCMMAGCVLACRACEEALGAFRPLASGAGMIAPLALLSVLVSRVLSPASVYRDHAPLTLNALVRTGPFRGLLTTPARRDFVEIMHRDVVDLSRGKRFVLFMPDMNAAYLSANARPAIPEMWVMNVPGRSPIQVEIFNQRLPEIGAVIIRSCPGANDWSNCTPSLLEPRDPLHAAVNSSFVESFRRYDYAVMRRR